MVVLPKNISFSFSLSHSPADLSIIQYTTYCAHSSCLCECVCLCGAVFRFVFGWPHTHVLQFLPSVFHCIALKYVIEMKNNLQPHIYFIVVVFFHFVYRFRSADYAISTMTLYTYIKCYMPSSVFVWLKSIKLTIFIVFTQLCTSYLESNWSCFSFQLHDGT